MKEFLNLQKENGEQALSEEVLIEMENLIMMKYPFEQGDSAKKIWAENAAEFLKNNPMAVKTFFEDFLEQWGSTNLGDPEAVRGVVKDLSLVFAELAKLASNADKE